jgi:hypothetical protein
MPARDDSGRTGNRTPAGPGCAQPWAWRRIGQVALAFRAAWNARGSGSSWGPRRILEARGSGSSWGPRRILEVTPAGPRGGCRPVSRSASRTKVHSTASSRCRPADGVRRDDGLLSVEEAVVEDDGRGRLQAVPHARDPAEISTGVRDRRCQRHGWTAQRRPVKLSITSWAAASTSSLAAAREIGRPATAIDSGSDMGGRHSGGPVK